MTTTTHNGGGRPRLIRSLGGSAIIPEGSTAGVVTTDEFDLVIGVTTIGSASDAHLQLAGLAPRSAQIRQDAEDEFVFENLASDARINGAETTDHALHTGDRIDLGDWTFSYFRDESADHGRPYGGRQGGELSDQAPQPPRAEQVGSDGPAT